MICVWCTDHPISQQISMSLAKGLHADLRHTGDLARVKLNDYDCHIAYGILRGTTEIFRACERAGLDWFNVDRGYFGPGHFEGNYRISHRGTQFRWRGPRAPLTLPTGRKLVVPPTEHVCEFFGINQKQWIEEHAPADCVIRHKGDESPIDWNVSGVVTFNSSLGWQALERGIPVESDPLHSAVGSFFNTKCIEFCKNPGIDWSALRQEMVEHQFTLEEIERGNAWGLITRYLSDGTHAKQSLQKSPPTPSNDAPNPKFESTI